MFKWKEIQENPNILSNFKSSEMINIECGHCGGNVSQMVKYVKKHLKDGYKNKFCSKECNTAHTKTREDNCLNCNKELVKGQFKFYTKSCSASFNNKKNSTAPIRKKRSVRTPKPGVCVNTVE